MIGIGRPGSILTIELEARGPQTVLGLKLSGVADSNGKSEPQPDQELLQRLELGISRSIFEAGGGTFSIERSAQSLTVNARLSRNALDQHEAQRTQTFTKESQGLEPS